MSKSIAKTPAGIAIHDGIGAQLLELGFKRKSARLYLKDTGDLSEWVHFRVDGGVEFTELYGVFDNALQRFFDENLDGFDTSQDENPRPLHLQSWCYVYAVGEANVAAKEWRAARRPWRPREYFQDPPKDLTPYSPCVSAWNKLYAADDPAGCAESSRALWTEMVEPLRNELIADPLAVANQLSEAEKGFPEFRIGLEVYLGNLAKSREIAEYFMSFRGVPPSKERLERTKLNRMQRNVSDEEYVEIILANNEALHSRVSTILDEFRL